jgi:hypothetical protein
MMSPASKGQRSKEEKQIPPSTDTSKATSCETWNVQHIDRESHRHRFLFFLVNLIGTEVEVEICDGRKFTGIFYTGTSFAGENFDIVIKLARRTDGTRIGQIIDIVHEIIFNGS